MKGMDATLLRLYGPVLWRALRVANPTVRAQVCQCDNLRVDEALAMAEPMYACLYIDDVKSMSIYPAC